MNDSLIRKFCESRYRWLIVAIVTAIPALAGVLPEVDDYYAKRNSRNELAEELVHARATAQELPLREARAAEAIARVREIESRTVDEARQAQFRNRIVEIVRESGCQIRQFDVGAPTRRQWRKGDDPLKDPVGTPAAAVATPFVLERRAMSLSVDGSMQAIHELLNRLEDERTLTHPHRLHLQGASGEGETATLQLELWLFALVRGQA